MQWIQRTCRAAGAALIVVACNCASGPRPAGSDHGATNGQGNAANTISSSTSPPATEIVSRDLDPVVRREIGLDLEAEADLDPKLRREIGLDPDDELDPQLRREIGLDPVPNLSPALRREVGLDPRSP